MSSFKFHLVTIIGIFVALATGIFIGSSFTENEIIDTQREALERSWAKEEELAQVIKELELDIEEQNFAMALMKEWLGELSEAYWAANPVEKKALLIYDSDFTPEYLGSYINGNVIRTQVLLETRDVEHAQMLARAFISSSADTLAWLKDHFTLRGDLYTPPDIVLIALRPGSDTLLEKELANAFLQAGVPVVALGKSHWDGVGGLLEHDLFASVGHLDSPLGIYCLGEILRGQLGHFNFDNILPLPGGIDR